MWVRILERERLVVYNALLNEFAREEYRRFMRMKSEMFHELLERIRPYITNKQTFMRKPISGEEKLAVMLRFLATGEDFESLSFLFRMHHNIKFRSSCMLLYLRNYKS